MKHLRSLRQNLWWWDLDKNEPEITRLAYDKILNKKSSINMYSNF